MSETVKEPEQCGTKPRKFNHRAIKIDKKEDPEHLDKLVLESVRVFLNKLLNTEADALYNASRYKRSQDRLDTRAGTYTRKLLTRIGEARPQFPPASVIVGNGIRSRGLVPTIIR